MNTPNKVMPVPAGFTRDFQVTDGTSALLGLPKVQQRLIAAEIIPRFGIKPFLKVRFPLWIIGVCLVSDLDMPFDGGWSRKMA